MSNGKRRFFQRAKSSGVTWIEHRRQRHVPFFGDLTSMKNPLSLPNQAVQSPVNEQAILCVWVRQKLLSFRSWVLLLDWFWILKSKFILQEHPTKSISACCFEDLGTIAEPIIALEKALLDQSHPLLHQSRLLKQSWDPIRLRQLQFSTKASSWYW